MKSETVDLIPRAELRGFLNHIRNRIYIFTGIFTLGFIFGYPLSEEIINWFLESDGFKPDEVEIIILQPMEVILLKLSMSVKIGFLLLLIAFILDMAWNGKGIIDEAKRNIESTRAYNLGTISYSIIFSIFLGLLGIIYSHEILIPMLLDYLARDATTSGLVSTWRLKSWIGFISGLYFSSIVGFQIPLIVILFLRSGIVSRDNVIENRRFLWFICLLFGALVSPPDPLSLFLVGGPILILLELTLIVDKIILKNDV
ncbi:MAG: twin-arginine translocase subunit TatC [Candidatus Thalassarchaeaceae archaeon]|nr:twin-arginine translocase subunit TatC [Candidatus Thalassarchaeaceae archaeon]